MHTTRRVSHRPSSWLRGPIVYSRVNSIHAFLPPTHLFFTKDVFADPLNVMSLK